MILGGKIKALNQLYNKLHAKYYSILRKGHEPKEGQHTSKRLRRLAKKRHDRIKDAFHKMSRYVVDFAVEHEISKIVIGHNVAWKQESNIGRVNNQNFVFLPHSLLISMIQYKAKAAGIDVIVPLYFSTEGNLLMENKQNVRHGYTFGQCLKEFLEDRFELVDGSVYFMTPPSHIHQEASVNLVGELWSYLKKTNTNCRVYHAPTGLFFDGDAEIQTSANYVEPDVFLICPRKYVDGFVVGVPHLIIEILSPSTSKHDKITKMNLYQKYLVPEYWIVDPANEMIEVYQLKDGQYQFPITYTKEDKLTFALYGNQLAIELQNIFIESELKILLNRDKE